MPREEATESSDFTFLLNSAIYQFGKNTTDTMANTKIKREFDLDYNVTLCATQPITQNTPLHKRAPYCIPLDVVSK